MHVRVSRGSNELSLIRRRPSAAVNRCNRRIGTWLFGETSAAVLCRFYVDSRGRSVKNVPTMTIPRTLAAVAPAGVLEDPEYLEKPSSFTMLWDYRPDLSFLRAPRSAIRRSRADISPTRETNEEC